MAELKNEPIIAVKGRFRAPNQRYYGQFFYLINNKGGYIDIASVVITAGPDLYHALTPTDSWKKYESLINKLKYENKYSQAITNEFQAKLKQLSLDKQYFADLMKAVVGNKAETLNFVLASFYRRVIKDDEFYLEGHAEKASLDGTEEAPPAEEADLSGADGIYLPVKLDLDPISGKDVKEIRPGDKILVRVLPETERANAFIDGAGLRTESGFIRSAPFTVTSVIYPGVGVEIVGKLKDGIYGKILEEQNVLVRMAQPVKAATPAKAQVPLPTSIPDDRKQLTLIAIGIVGIALLGIALYWVISSL
jgi:hypothetical protein